MLMTKGMPFCSATWAIAVDCPESKAPTRSCAPSADQLLGTRARHLDVGLGVGVHELQAGQTELLQDARRDVDAALAVLPDAGLGAGARQQYADLQGSALRSQDGGRGNESGGGGRAGGKLAARDRTNRRHRDPPRLDFWRHGRGARRSPASSLKAQAWSSSWMAGTSPAMTTHGLGSEYEPRPAADPAARPVGSGLPRSTRTEPGSCPRRSPRRPCAG